MIANVIIFALVVGQSPVGQAMPEASGRPTEAESRVVVRDAQDLPVPGATITAIAKEPAHHRDEATTDGSGEATLGRRLGSGRYEIQVDVGSRTERVEIEINTDLELAELRIRLGPTAGAEHEMTVETICRARMPNELLVGPVAPPN